jgi:hypothetical protein
VKFERRLSVPTVAVLNSWIERAFTDPIGLTRYVSLLNTNLQSRNPYQPTMGVRYNQ